MQMFFLRAYRRPMLEPRRMIRLGSQSSRHGSRFEDQNIVLGMFFIWGNVFFWSTYVRILGGGPDTRLQIKFRWPYHEFVSTNS